LYFDIRSIPFSRRGSWLSFSFITGDFAKRTGLEGLFLRTVRDCGDSREILRVETVAEGHLVPFEIEASPFLLRLVADEGLIEILMPEADTVRVRGRGVGMRLTAIAKSEFETFLPANDRAWVFNSFGSATSLYLHILEGDLTVDAPWVEKHVTHLTLDISAKGKSDTFQVILQEFKSGLPDLKGNQRSFEQDLVGVSEDFELFKAGLPEIPAEYESEKELAAYINWSCLVDPDGLIRRPAMLMSKNWMTNVWSWDHCFNALALSYKNPELAWDQFMLFFDHQDRFGAIPDSINVSKAVWNFAKPPIHGWALMKMIENGAVDTRRMEEAYPPLCRWTEWWFKYRDYDGDGIPQYNHGNDSGWDNGTVFNRRPPIESPDLVTFLILQMETLAQVAARLGRDDEAGTWNERWRDLLDKFLQHSVRRDRLVALGSGSHEEVPNESLLPYMALLLGNKLPEKVLHKLVESLQEAGFLTEWGAATERTTSPDYLPDGYWRGPIWAPSTLLIADGLLNAGEADLAYSVVQKFARMIKKSGFAENYNALTGEGLRDRAYTWTSSTFLVLAHDFLLNKNSR
jgi:putative isomerase